MFAIEKRLVPNFATRGSHKPICIVDHITIGARDSVINTFMRAGGNSSHYLVCRDGAILQFVELTKRAHTNGYVRSPKSPLVKAMGDLNANFYTVTIEHEGYEDQGGDGSLTEEQFTATCWLHKWIQTEVLRIYQVRIPLNSHQVIAHNQIDSRKGTCPGVNYPWKRLYAELARIDPMTMESYEEDLSYRQSMAALGVDAYAFLNRFKVLEERLTDPQNGSEAVRKVLLMVPVMEKMGLTTEPTVVNIIKRIKDLGEVSIVDGTFQKEGLRKLNIGIQHAKNVGLIA